MKFSYNWLQSFFDKKLPEPKELAELLTMHSFEVEELEKKGADWIFHIDVLPNRASDCLSHWGIARECSALSNVKCQMSPKLAAGASGQANVKSNSKSKVQSKAVLDVQIVGSGLCARYAAYVVEGIEIKESPKWVTQRLAAMEQKSINNVVDITNYVLWELGQPLHAFDFYKIKGARMTIRTSREAEKLTTLDGATHNLGDNTVIIEDGERIIDLAGIKGGANTQVDGKSSAVIFQAAIFDASRIYQTSKRLGVRTDASVRYSHGFDPDLPLAALERAVELLKETNPKANIVQKIDIYPKPANPKKIALDVNYINRLLGTYLSIREITQILERLGFSVSKGKLQASNVTIHVTVPVFRLDVAAQEDLIEEIGRIYGYEKIKPDSPRGTLVSPRRNENVFWRSFVREVLSGFGFSEVYNYSLAPLDPESSGLQAGDERSSAVKFNKSPVFQGGDLTGFIPNLKPTASIRSSERRRITHNLKPIEVANPVSDEFRYLRGALLPGILKDIAFNIRGVHVIQVFEMGNVFFQEGLHGVRENENCILAIAASDNRGSEERFYELKGYTDELFQKLGITDFYYDSAFDEGEAEYFSHFHTGRRALIVLNERKVGVIGEVHSKALATYDIEGRVYAMEVNFNEVRSAAEEEHIYQKPSRYPEVVRDISLLVPQDTMVEEALNAINEVSGPLLRDVDLFDMYEGDNLPDGRKSLAFHLLFQSDERTLTSKEIDEIMAEIVKALEEKLWEVR